MTEITPIRSTAEVQADIDALIASIADVDDQIFAGEQVSTDYRGILSDPTIGANNLTMLAVLRERRRALEIALEAARKDLKGAEHNELREETRKRRELLKVLLNQRNEKAGAAFVLLQTAVTALLKIRQVDISIIKECEMTQRNPLTENGYLVLTGIQVLNDKDLVADWAMRVLEKGLLSGGRMYFDFQNQVEEVSRNVLRQWDIVNGAARLKVVEHDPMVCSDGEAVAPTPETVEQFDPDPTDDDLASIADLPPEKAAKAMKAFENSRWARSVLAGKPNEAADKA